MAPAFITFLSDFGLQDDFVGTCHGVIKRISPEAEIIDITHGIQPRQVLQGALVLASTVPYMPVGVHLAVVDPGVGSTRRAVVLTGRDGRRYVGPDNGLLVTAAERLGGVGSAHELTSPAHRLEPVSATFHGRDVFSPAAAHLATGVEPGELGPPVDPDTLVRLALPVAEVERGRIRATILAIDRFGNLQLNLDSEQLERAGIEPGARLELELRGGRSAALAGRTFSDAAPGETVVYVNPYGSVSVAVSSGDAAHDLSLAPGQELRITVAR